MTDEQRPGDPAGPNDDPATGDPTVDDPEAQGPDPVDPDRVDPETEASDPAVDEAGLDEAGADEVGPDEAGPDEAGLDEAGPDEDGDPAPVAAGAEDVEDTTDSTDESTDVDEAAGHDDLGDDELGPEWGVTAEQEAVPAQEGRSDDATSVAAYPPGLFVEDDASTTETEQAPRKRRWGRKVLLGAVLALGALYLVGYALTGSRMPANATIGGVDVSGMSPDEAREVVDAELSPRVDDPVQLVHERDGDTQEFEVTAQDAGLAFDVERSVADAGGTRSWDPRVMYSLFFGERDHAPAVDVDGADLQAAVERIGEGVNVDVVEPLITFPDAEPEARQPEAGLEIDAEEAARTIRDAYLVQTEPVPVPTTVVEPSVDEEGLETAMTTIAEPAVSAPVTIEVGDEDEVELPVSAYAPALTVGVRDGSMVPKIDAEKLAGPLTDSTTGIGEKAVDATIDIVDGKPEITPGQEGVGLQPQEMSEKLIPALTESGDTRVVQVEASVVEPEFTTEDAEALGVTERVSEFETYYPHADYRNINQGRAAEILDGTLLKPGETFSFNDTVGERTEANGFTTGSVINGGQFRDELGGGVSQVVTTTYNAAFFAGMDDVEHHPHAFYIDRYPVGREATVYFGSLDLRFKNSTDHGVLIKASVQRSTPGTRGVMRVEMWSTKVWDIEAGASERRNARTPGTRYDETNACVPQAPLQGFDIDIYRTFKQNGETVKSETVTANYQAADRVICGPRPGSDDDDDDDD